MRRAFAQFPITTPPSVPDYHGMAGEQEFYDAVTRNLGWFEREMQRLNELLRQRRTADLSGRTVTASH